jgi:RND superfamily putative drug exporter
MGTGGVIVALIGVTVSLIVLPAVLMLLGPRVNAGSLPFLRRAAEHSALPAQSGFWYRLSHAVMRRPGTVAVSSAAVLILLGLPFLNIRFTGVDASDLPTSQIARQVDDSLKADFPPSRGDPTYIAAHTSSAPAAAAFAARLRTLPGAAAVSQPVRAGTGLYEINVISKASGLASTSKDLVRDIRQTAAPFSYEVGGLTAGFLDQQTSLKDHIPLALAILVLITLVVLFLMTGSVVLPIKAIIMNTLSLSAAFGLLVLIFQDGRLEGLLSYTSKGALESTQPILLFAIAFGLSTDYGVLLLGRIKEAHDSGIENREAVALGVERTGRLITAAALLFCVAIGAFATSQIVFIKEIGVGTALAVLIDASIVRALLVPSLMDLLGDANWWAPRPLARLHARLGLSEG